MDLFNDALCYSAAMYGPRYWHVSLSGVDK